MGCPAQNKNASGTAAGLRFTTQSHMAHSAGHGAVTHPGNEGWYPDASGSMSTPEQQHVHI